MASRALSDLHQDTRRMAAAGLEACANDPWLIDNGITVLVICTARGRTEQALLYAQGRTRAELDAVGLTDIAPRAGKIVTKATPGKSPHNAEADDGEPEARAIDVVPLRYGKMIWGTAGDGVDEDPADDATDDLEVWQRVAAHFKRAGLRWYGEPGAAFREFPHFQDPAWRPS